MTSEVGTVNDIHFTEGGAEAERCLITCLTHR